MQALSTDELRNMRSSTENLSLIDVLPSSSYREEHIPGSISIPLESDNFVDQVNRAVGGRTQPVVVYCANTSCDLSPKASKKLEEAGFAHVFDYEGGLDAWKKAELPVERGGSPSSS